MESPKITEHKCETCNIEFHNVSNLRRHYKSKTHLNGGKKVEYRCRRCNYLGYDKTKFEDHLDTKKHHRSIDMPNRLRGAFIRFNKASHGLEMYDNARRKYIERFKLKPESYDSDDIKKETVFVDGEEVLVNLTRINDFFQKEGRSKYNRYIKYYPHHVTRFDADYDVATNEFLSSPFKLVVSIIYRTIRSRLPRAMALARWKEAMNEDSCSEVSSVSSSDESSSSDDSSSDSDSQ